QTHIQHLFPHVRNTVCQTAKAPWFTPSAWTSIITPLPLGVFERTRHHAHNSGLTGITDMAETPGMSRVCYEITL
ncbi:MAG: hypothetical protein MKZ95_02155, partial [Pirellulales bacterium]|nr:hypothetical protein [Pirellulales bacterium]